MIRIAIVEDDKDLRLMMEQFFNLQADMHVEKVYANGNLFLNDFMAEDFDVVLMDINMPGKSGIECIAEAKPLKPKLQFIVSTSSDNQEYIFQSLCAGASGYLLKTQNAAHLIEAVRDVMQGGSPMSPNIARMVVASFQKPKEQTETLSILTEREREIITYLSQGLDYKDIAAKLFISPETVRKHIRNMYEKLHVTSKTDAINKVFPRG